jgi:uncharacterized protein (TIGR02246 family)
MQNAVDNGSIAAEGERQVRALLARMFEAWDRGDGEAYAACFTEDCDYVTFNGIHLRGRAENSRLHGALFRSVLRGTRLSADVESIEFLAPGVALMHTAGSGRKKSVQTYVLTKVGADWLIKSFQNTKVQPFSAWMTRLMGRNRNEGECVS